MKALTWSVIPIALFLAWVCGIEGQWLGAMGWLIVAFDDVLYLAQLYMQEARKP